MTFHTWERFLAHIMVCELNSGAEENSWWRKILQDLKLTGFSSKVTSFEQKISAFDLVAIPTRNLHPAPNLFLRHNHLLDLLTYNHYPPSTKNLHQQQLHERLHHRLYHEYAHLVHFDLLHGFPPQLAQVARPVLVVLAPSLHLLCLSFHLQAFVQLEWGQKSWLVLRLTSDNCGWI